MDFRDLIQRRGDQMPPLMRYEGEETAMAWLATQLGRP